MASAGARAIVKVARPTMMRGYAWNDFRKALLFGTLTCWVPGVIFDHYVTNPRIKSYKDFYTNYNPNKDAWDMVYDCFPALNLPVPIPPWLREEDEEEDDD